ncbi:hypothetical protein ACLFLC_16240 [Providencia rettgeri]
MKLTTLLATSAVLVTASVAAKEYQINHTDQLKSLNDATKSTEVWEKAEVLTDFTYHGKRKRLLKQIFVPCGVMTHYISDLLQMIKIFS